MSSNQLLWDPNKHKSDIKKKRNLPQAPQTEHACKKHTFFCSFSCCYSAFNFAFNFIKRTLQYNIQCLFPGVEIIHYQEIKNIFIVTATGTVWVFRTSKIEKQEQTKKVTSKRSSKNQIRIKNNKKYGAKFLIKKCSHHAAPNRKNRKLHEAKKSDIIIIKINY